MQILKYLIITLRVKKNRTILDLEELDDKILTQIKKLIKENEITYKTTSVRVKK